MSSNSVKLPRDSNQAHGIGQFALDFMAGKLGAGPSAAVLERTRLFHTDSVLCGLSALALRTNAPTLLRAEALEYPDADGACVFGFETRVKSEKAVVANCSAVREWDSNGTNFGYNPALGHLAGEFGHNDFYPVVIAACQELSLDGATALKAMVLLDEIRGRLSEVFSLKTYKIDHVVYGAIGSAATYGALHGASAEQIEHAIGMFVAHYIPWRAIRAGKQLSDSKGASAAISTEAAILCMKRALRGFIGPKDIFRNPESMFRQFIPTNGDSPFDLVLSHSGDDFAVMGMHFKLGLYEHQSAGALQGVITAIESHPHLLNPGEIQKITIRAYEPAFGIIGDPAKRAPTTRQSADHSMVYIVSRLIVNAIEQRESLKGLGNDELWKALMLSPQDFHASSIHDPATQAMMATIAFEHGGPEYDRKYPDGIPTSVVITDASGNEHDSGMVMYPAGHARNTTADIVGILKHKFAMLGDITGNPEAATKVEQISQATPAQIMDIYNTPVTYREGYE
ncbi:MAG: MmgE/PrpD family protein [Armatimonadetes bacterium]|nr:MmgE/PrpD family protein [Armatimonadota bacterium]